MRLTQRSRDLARHAVVAEAALVACALVAGGCSTLRATAAWVASPALQTAAPELDAEEDCAEQPHRVPAARSDRRVRIGTWNIRYLGPSEETPEELRDPRRLAACVARSGVSVLALQEIGAPAGSDSPRSSTLDALFGALREEGGDWTYVLFGGARDPSQHMGLAWDRRAVTLSEEPLPLDLRGEAPSPIPFVPLPFGSEVWPRKPAAFKFSTGTGLTDFVVVPVHLTARVETWFFEDATAHRAVEAKLLVQRLGDVVAHFRDRDVVVLGDFNVEVATEEVADALVEAGWRDLNCADLTTAWPGLPLDRVFVPADQPEFGLRPNFARVVPPDARSWDEYLERYSDHLLVIAEILLTRDDD